MDLIDRDALMKTICGNECGSVCDEECENAMCNFYDYIMNAPVVNNWISVEDALPEKEGNYLCTLYYAIPPYNLFHPEKDTYIREVSVKFFDGKSFIASVVAWMPMPDAYKPPEKEYYDET